MFTFGCVRGYVRVYSLGFRALNLSARQIQADSTTLWSHHVVINYQRPIKRSTMHCWSYYWSVILELRTVDELFRSLTLQKLNV